DVGNVKFVEAHQAKPPGDAGSDREQRVFLARERLELFVYAAHEHVGVHPRLSPQRYRCVEGIHQKALSRSHGPPEVNAARRRRGLQPTQQRLARLLESDELIVQALPPLERRPLRAVEHEAATDELRLEMPENGAAIGSDWRGVIHVASPAPSSAPPQGLGAGVPPPPPPPLP